MRQPLFDRKALLASFLPSCVLARRRFAVRTSGRLRGENTAELVEHPVLRRIESLEMFLEAPRHVSLCERANASWKGGSRAKDARGDGEEETRKRRGRVP